MSLINPRVDIAFKKLFGVEANKDLLISLINSIVGEKDQIDDVELLNPYNERNFQNDKLSILDVKARNKHNQQLFNIEMQIANEGSYDKRSLYNWAKLYAGQLSSGIKYDSLKKTIGIHILNYSSVSRKFLSTLDAKDQVLYDNRYHYQFNMREKEIPFNYFDDIELHIIELSSFEGNSDDALAVFLPKVKNALDRWSALLTKHDLLNPDNLPKELDTPEIKKALDVLKIMSFSEEEREAYENHLTWIRIQISALEKMYEDGKLEGKREGEKQGERRGEKKGKLDERRIIAKNMLDQGFEIAIIAKITGLTADEIRNLK